MVISWATTLAIYTYVRTYVHCMAVFVCVCPTKRQQADFFCVCQFVSSFPLSNLGAAAAASCMS